MWLVMVRSEHAAIHFYNVYKVTFSWDFILFILKLQFWFTT